MRARRVLIFYILIAISAIPVLLYFYAYQPKAKTLGSPLPDVLTLYSNNQVSTLDLWNPIVNAAKTFLKDEPQISATSALAYDVNDEKTLYFKNPNEKLPMASLTKIVTAIVSLENPENPALYKVLRQDLVGENVMGLSFGEMLSLNDLLYGLLLNSGNDAAETLATNYKGGRDAFIKAMNNKVVALGASNTHFTNPSGLQGDGKQYTTAHDLLVITKYALSNPTFTKIVGTYEYHVAANNYHKGFDLYNETNLLTSYPGVAGVKDGYTDEAGLCLVTYLDYNGKKIIGILLGSSNRRQEMKELLDYSLKQLRVKPPPHS